MQLTVIYWHFLLVQQSTSLIKLTTKECHWYEKGYYFITLYNPELFVCFLVVNKLVTNRGKGS